MMSQRSNVLAERLEQGARELAAFAATLTPAQWATRVPKDGRTVGVIVHHVANMYPIEIQIAQAVGAGQPVAGVSWDDVHAINAGHAKEFARSARTRRSSSCGKTARRRPRPFAP